MQIIKWLPILSLASLVACNGNAQNKSEESGTDSDLIVLTGATLIIGDGTPAIPAANIVIENSKILCAGVMAACPVPDGARVHDMSGKYIMPGLVDAHVHYSQTGWIDGRPDVIYLSDNYPYTSVYEEVNASTERYFQSYLCSGVTATYDVGGYYWTIDLEDTAQNSSTAPFVEAVGPLLTPNVPPVYEAEVGEPMMLLLDSPEAGRTLVQEIAESGANAVKVAFQIPPGNQQQQLIGLMNAVGDEAQALDLPLIVHATDPVWAKAAVRAGAHLLVHNIAGAPVDEELIELMQANDTLMTPTTIAAGYWGRAIRAAINLTAPPLDDVNGCVDPVTREKLANVPNIVKPAGSPPPFDEAAMAAFEEGVAADIALAQANLKALYDAGITMAVGTDAGNPLTLHGASIYEELEVTQAAGIPALDVITMATLNGARAMGREDQFGTLEAGKTADLIVLGADPSADIANMRQLEWVMRNGVLHNQQDLRYYQPE